jgi:hypothetical protein
MKLALVLLCGSVVLVGCGVGPNPSCVPKPYLQVFPTTATADHAAVAPGNQAQFTVNEGETYYSSSGTVCAVPAVLALVHPVWTNPEPQQISISSANDSTNGLAKCLEATNGPVTLTGTVGSGAQALSITAQLSCK